MIEIQLLDHCGFIPALHGLGKSYGLTTGRNMWDWFNDPEYPKGKLLVVANDLAFKGNGENKFLESIMVWLEVMAPRYWWSEADTYRIGCSKQSESTMHTILNHELTQDDFAHHIDWSYLEMLNQVRCKGDWYELKGALPESYLQTRVWCLNYKTLQNIYSQRHNHRLKEWREFCEWMTFNLKKEYIVKGEE